MSGDQVSQDQVNQDQVNQDKIIQDKLIYDGLITLIKQTDNWQILNNFRDRFEINEKFVFEELNIDVNNERQFNWFKLYHPVIFKIMLDKLLKQNPPPSKEKLTEIFIHLCNQYNVDKTSNFEVLQNLLDKGVDITTCGKQVIVMTSKLILFEFILKSGYKVDGNDIITICKCKTSVFIHNFMLILSKYCHITAIPDIQKTLHSYTNNHNHSRYNSFSSRLIQEYQKLFKETNKKMYYAVKLDTTEEPGTNFPNLVKVQKDNIWYIGYLLEEFSGELDDKKTVLSQIGKPGFYML